MSPIELVEVNTPQLEKAFLKVNVDINKDNPNYIQPLENEINDVFNQKKNKAFRSGTVIRWVLKKDDQYI